MRRRARPPAQLVGLVIAAAALHLSPLAAPAAGEDLVEAGRALYERGRIGEHPAPVAYFGPEDVELTAAALPCVGCHGDDGTGRPESGIEPADIRWRPLTRPDGHVHRNGSAHPAFDDASLTAYLRTGRFPGGAPGTPEMPRYDLSDAEAASLVAYLQKLGSNRPGVAPDRIALATVVPAEGVARETGEAIRRVLRASVDRINGDGGIYGRRLELATLEHPADAPLEAEDLSAWLREVRPLALVSPFAPRSDLALQVGASRAGVPVIGAFSPFAPPAYADNRLVFTHRAGVLEQAQALVRDEAARRQQGARAAVLTAGEAVPPSVVQAVRRTCEEHGWELAAVPSGAGAAKTAAALHASGVEVIVQLGFGHALAQILDAGRPIGWEPRVLWPGSLAGGGLAGLDPASSEHVRVAYPTLPSDREDWALRQLSQLLQGRSVPRSEIQATLSAYAAAEILVEGLRRAGRELSRDRLVTALESLYQYETGVLPAVTFTTNRRVGASGAWILEPPAEGSAPAADRARWVPLDAS